MNGSTKSLRRCDCAAAESGPVISSNAARTMQWRRTSPHAQLDASGSRRRRLQPQGQPGTRDPGDLHVGRVLQRHGLLPAVLNAPCSVHLESECPDLRAGAVQEYDDFRISPNERRDAYADIVATDVTCRCVAAGVVHWQEDDYALLLSRLECALE